MGGTERERNILLRREGKGKKEGCEANRLGDRLKKKGSERGCNPNLLPVASTDSILDCRKEEDDKKRILEMERMSEGIIYILMCAPNMCRRVYM